ncbi:hypothetical protein Hte_009457 [Hypoxylon texense]
MASDRMRIAIIGGGLAGASLANALVQFSHLDIHVYESAPEFSERGAAVGLASNTQRALQHILPSAKEMLRKAGAVSLNSSRAMIGSGPEAGTVIFDIESGKDALVVHRASLLRELLAPLPKDLLHANKKLTSIDRTDAGVEISFQDGSTELFDGVIGADGVFGSVRKYVLQDANEWSASPSGFWDSRNLVPFEKARDTIGKEYFEVDRQIGWLGDGAYLMHDVLEDRTVVQCVMSGIDRVTPKDRKHALTRENLTEELCGWLDGPIAKNMIELLLDQPNPEGYSSFEHKSTSSYANGRICIMGDAAHAMTPWQGAGAGQAIEDAVILGTVLGAISRPEEIDAAFKAFDAIRRPRCQRIIDSSRGTGEIFCGRNPDVGLDLQKLRDALSVRWGFIHDIDLSAHKQEALGKLREFKEI